MATGARIGATGATVAERAIWNPTVIGRTTVAAQTAVDTRRGVILEKLAGNNPAQGGLGRYARDADRLTPKTVQQIKSTRVADPRAVAQISRDATRDAARFIRDNPATAGARAAQAHVIVPAGASDATVRAATTALAASRRPIPNSAPPQVTRGLPGLAGTAARTLTVAGGALSTVALVDDVRRGDAKAAIGDGAGAASSALALGGGALGSTAAVSAGAVTGAFALGYGVGAVLAEHVIPERAQIWYGGAIVHGLAAIGIDLEK
jgi:hypothetical protein